ncbi:hypothetical protein HL658_30615 [Azospirillum sp. RWY-5-1]|uniref:Uncharacterized protein n=1 Tax=Azospirillum oleiclasticum TaxID=2735135 RepID=A0ABX2TC27_9PROT|nr:hypothetical protein [Azospirillum oleiclasticum]NYZ16918.1 hypothetical protein [Azospirillum oleiclasticum]NYZ21855.1 hypothetical protein [Azospirillum oleiclasticum]
MDDGEACYGDWWGSGRRCVAGAAHPKAPAGGKLLALVDVAITPAGVRFTVHDIRVSREIPQDKHATSVASPLHRDLDDR